MPRLTLSLLLLLIAPALLAWGREELPARRDAATFVLETLRKKEGETWERTGQFLLWTYGFDRARCELTVQREAELGDVFRQRIPLKEAIAVGSLGSEIVFECRRGDACIAYEISNRQQIDARQVAKSRVMVMDPDDLTPLMNAFAELHQLCRDPYAPYRQP